jgi:hypothetical protein
MPQNRNAGLFRALALMAGVAYGAASASAQAPPPVPALPDAPRLTTYNLSGSNCNCAVGFQLYGDGTDVDAWLQVFIGSTPYLSTDPTHGWAITSLTGSLGAIPRPITNAVLTFAMPQTGAITIVGDRRPRRTSQFPENRGVDARSFNQVLTDIVATQREMWDKQTTGSIGGSPPSITGAGSVAISPSPCTGSSGSCTITGSSPSLTGAGSVTVSPSPCNSGTCIITGATGGATNPPTVISPGPGVTLAPNPCITGVSGTCTVSAGGMTTTSITAGRGASITPSPCVTGSSGSCTIVADQTCVDAVRVFGLVNDGSTDNTAALNNMIADLNGLSRQYCITSGIYRYNGPALNPITSSGGGIRGIGGFAVVLQDTATSGDSWKINASGFLMEGFRFHPLNLKVTGSEIRCAGGALGVGLRDLWFEYVATPMTSQFCTGLQIDRVVCRPSYSEFGCLFVQGNAGAPNNAVNIRNMIADNPWQCPAGAPAGCPRTAQNRGSWAATTTYALGDYFNTPNGYVWIVTTAGTSGTTVAPYVLPNTDAGSPYNTDIVDNSVRARFVSHVALTWIYQGSYSYSLKVTDSELIDGAHCVWMDDQANTGTSFPAWFEYEKMDCDHQYSDGVLLNAGRGFRGTTGYFDSSLTGNGIVETPNYLGENSISGGEIVGNAQHGYEMNNPNGRYTTINGVIIGYNGQQTANVFNGIAVAPLRGDWIAIGNMFGPNNNGLGTDSQHCAILTNGSTDAPFIVTNNIARSQANGTSLTSSFCFGSTMSVSVRANNVAH